MRTFLRTSSYSTEVTENLLCGSILILIMTVLRWYLNLFFEFNTGSFAFWKFLLQLWLTGTFRLGTVFTKDLLNTYATSLSSQIISSEKLVELSLYFFSTKVNFDFVLTLSVNKGFTTLEKVLLSVTPYVLRLLTNFFLACLIKLTHRFCCAL